MESPRPEHLLKLYHRILSEEKLVERIKDTTEREKIEKYILSISHNHLREMVNVMEKLVVYFGEDVEPITESACRALFLTRIYQSFQDYLLALRQGNMQESIAIMYSVVANGYSIVDIFDAFFKFMKMTDLLTEMEKYEVVKVLCEYITIIHKMHEENIEMVCFTNKMYKIMQNQIHSGLHAI
jgi:DNA polymerase III gamma/tau subunit